MKWAAVVSNNAASPWVPAVASWPEATFRTRLLPARCDTPVW